MAKLVSRQKFTPSGGFLFYQPEIKWQAPPHASFDTTVRGLIAARMANPVLTARFKWPTDYETVAEEVDAFNAAVCAANGWQDYFTTGGAGTGPFPNPSHSPNPFPPGPQVAAAGERGSAVWGIKRAAQGTAVVMDWLLSGGKPVEPALAIKRAETCVACPKNVEGSWYTVAPAEIIRTTLSARSDLKLETPQDAGLKSCDVCKCLNRLKVWCPLDHILGHTHPAVLSEFPGNCWIARRDQ